MLGKNKKGKALPSDGQLYGVEPSRNWSLPKPPGMVYIPPGTFHMGPSDEDMNFAYTARNKQVSINSFWMDATEITNNEYRQFTNWVRDSIAAKLMGYVKAGTDGVETIDWKKAKTIKWGDKATMEKVDAMILTPDNRIFNKKEIDPTKLVFHSEIFDFNITNLRELRLNWNNISAKGGIYLADSLRNNRHLRFLDIGWNHCGIGANI
jgi:hypothetical protein